LDGLSTFSSDRIACSISELKYDGKHLEKDIMYDRSVINSLCDLMEEIWKAFLLMNASKRGNIIKVIVNNGNEIHN